MNMDLTNITIALGFLAVVTAIRGGTLAPGLAFGTVVFAVVATVVGRILAK